MDNSFDIKDSSRPKLIQISEEEIGIINDIRRLDFGRVVAYVQNGVVINKEVTIITKHKHKNSSSAKNPAYQDQKR